MKIYPTYSYGEEPCLISFQHEKRIHDYFQDSRQLSFSSSFHIEDFKRFIELGHYVKTPSKTKSRNS